MTEECDEDQLRSTLTNAYACDERDMALRMHQVQFDRANRPEVQRQAVLDLCNWAETRGMSIKIPGWWNGQAVQSTGTGTVSVGLLRTALGAGGDTDG